MRAELAKAIVSLFAERRDMVFLTLDLGYMALESVAEALGERFVNAGVAEQNAISVAAGLAREGALPWVYSMAAFTTLRPYAQIRDNLCLQRLPVKLVGNGGGYGYGIMGATHHALEDVGAMRALPNMTVYVPLVAEDVAPVVQRMASDPLPNYLRLNTAARIPGEVPSFAPWRRLKNGTRGVVVAMGPVVQGLFEMPAAELLGDLEIWSVGTLPLEDVPDALRESIERTGRVVAIEEHYASCGLGEALAYRLLRAGIGVRSFTSIHATGYPSGRYGSQQWHQAESGLRGPALATRLLEVLRG